MQIYARLASRFSFQIRCRQCEILSSFHFCNAWFCKKHYLPQFITAHCIPPIESSILAEIWPYLSFRPLQDSDEKWDRARALTAQAQEQGRIAQTKTVEASATQREASEAMRRAEVARGAEQELQVCPLQHLNVIQNYKLLPKN